MSGDLLTARISSSIVLPSVIITGERRWRAALLIEMVTIPARIVGDLSEYHRFERQVIENLHHNTMTRMDMAWALAKLLKPNWSHGDQFNLEQGKDIGIRKLSKKIGKSHPWILETLSYLKEKEDVQAYLMRPDSKHSYIRDINRRSPEHLKNQFKKKVIEGEITDGSTIEELMRAVKRSPDKENELMEQSYTERMPGNLHKIHQLSPPIPENEVADITEEMTPEERARKAVKALNRKLLETTSLVGRVNEKINWNDIPPETLDMLNNTNKGLWNAFKIYMDLISAMWHRKVLEPQQEMDRLGE